MMKRKRYSVEQIVAAVKQHDMGVPAGDIARYCGARRSTAGRSSMGAWGPPMYGNSRNCGRRMPNSRSWWRNSAWTRRCCRRLPQKSGKRTRAPGCGALSLWAVWDQRTACVSGGPGVPGDGAGRVYAGMFGRGTRPPVWGCEGGPGVECPGCHAGRAPADFLR